MINELTKAKALEYLMKMLDSEVYDEAFIVYTDGSKHDSDKTYEFLSKSYGYHLRKAIKHLFLGIIFGYDKDSGKHHFLHASLRLKMALCVDRFVL